MRIGLHCSLRHGFAAALERAVSLGCDAFQIFPFHPRGWRRRVDDPDQLRLFRDKRRASGLAPLLVHSNYMPNLCSSRDDVYERSVAALRSDLQRCADLGAEFLVIHLGAASPGGDSEEALRRAAQGLNGALSEADPKVQVLIENVAGGRRRLGGRWEEIARIWDHVRDRERLGLCLDTCHAFSAGHDLRRPDRTEAMFESVERLFGPGRIKAVHVNDSRAELGSGLDLHEHLGRGRIGDAALQRVVRHPAAREAALILETPRDSATADQENLQRLRAYASGPKNS